MVSRLGLERVCLGYRDEGENDGEAKERERNPSRFRGEHGVKCVRR